MLNKWIIKLLMIITRLNNPDIQCTCTCTNAYMCYLIRFTCILINTCSDRVKLTCQEWGKEDTMFQRKARYN